MKYNEYEQFELDDKSKKEIKMLCKRIIQRNKPEKSYEYDILSNHTNISINFEFCMKECLERSKKMIG